LKSITFALAKGRLSDISIGIFEKLGYDVSQMKEKSRKLIFYDEKNKIKFILVKASDVPTYVEYQAADIGIVGYDTILEEGRHVYEMLNLSFGNCKMCVCGRPEMKDSFYKIHNLKVATKYPNIAKEFFEKEKKMGAEIIKLNGSVELAPLTGLSEVIVDIVESGKTLVENGLCVFEEICDISARLIVNRVSLKMERERINDIVEKIKGVII